MLRSRALCQLLSIAVFGVCLSTASRSRADEPEPRVRFDEDATPPESSRTRVLLLGSALTALTYGGAVGASFLWENDPGATDLRIPVVGPWIKLGHTTMCTDGDTSCNNVFQVVGAIATVLDGLGQLGGIGLLAEGIFAPGAKPQRQAAALQLRPQRGGAFSSRLILEAGDITFVPVPFFQSGSDAGIGLVGTF